MYSYLHVNMYASIHVYIAKLAYSVCCTTLAILAKQSRHLHRNFCKITEIIKFYSVIPTQCLSNSAFLLFLWWCLPCRRWCSSPLSFSIALGSVILLSSCDLFSFSSPAPSGFVSVPYSGLRSFFWTSFLYHPCPFGTWWWETTKGVACCFYIAHASAFDEVTYCRYGLPLSFSWRVSLYFSFAKLAQAVSGKYWSPWFPIPSEICRQPSAFSS